jgi:DNA polymerase III alpha subunit
MTNNKHEILPIFSSCGSLGKSILTTEDESEIKENSPVSILAIAKKYNLPCTTIMDESFYCFPNIYKNWSKSKIPFEFGIVLTVCNNALDKSEASRKTESKVAVFIRNSKGYEDLVRLHNKIKTNYDYFYYHPRADWKILEEWMTENLQLVIPPYDNFLHVNLINNGNCVPDFGKMKPTFLYANHDLLYDFIICKAVKDYASSHGYQTKEAHLIYYNSRADFKNYTVYRAKDKRSNFNAPNLSYFSSPEFCLESYFEKIGRKF